MEQRAQIDAEKNISANLTLDESVEFIEIYDERETLLANHLLSFGELQKGNQTQIFQLENGKKITFDLAPVFDKLRFRCSKVRNGTILTFGRHSLLQGEPK